MSSAMVDIRPKRNAEKRREKSRNDARYRRRSEANVFGQLCQLLPLAKEPSSSHLDRIAVVRIAAAVCRLRNLLDNMMPIRPSGESTVVDRAKWHNEEVLKEVLDGSMLLMVDLKGLIVYVTSSASQTVGIGQTELIGRNLFDYVHPEDAAELQMAARSCDCEQLVLRFRCALTPRGRSLSVKSSVYKTFLFDIKSSSSAGRYDCSAIGQNHCPQPISEPCLFMFGYEIMRGCCHGGSEGGRMVTRHAMDMKINHMDQRLQNLIGHPTKSVRGRSFHEFVHPDDLRMFSDAIRQLYIKDRTSTNYYRLIDRYGGVLWMRTEGAVFTECVRGIRSQRILCSHTLIGYASQDQRHCLPLEEDATIVGTEQTADLDH